MAWLFGGNSRKRKPPKICGIGIKRDTPGIPVWRVRGSSLIPLQLRDTGILDLNHNLVIVQSLPVLSSQFFKGVTLSSFLVTPVRGLFTPFEAPFLCPPKSEGYYPLYNANHNKGYHKNFSCIIQPFGIEYSTRCMLHKKLCVRCKINVDLRTKNVVTYTGCIYIKKRDVQRAWPARQKRRLLHLVTI